MIDGRRDGVVLVLLGMMVVLLLAAMTGAYRVFGYGLVALLGVLMVLGFARRDDRMTWGPPAAGIAVLLVALTGIFAYESAAVTTVDDTILGFQPATAFLIYGIWIPAFFTMAVGYWIVFDRVAASKTRKTQERPWPTR